MNRGSRARSFSTIRMARRRRGCWRRIWRIIRTSHSFFLHRECRMPTTRRFLTARDSGQGLQPSQKRLQRSQVILKVLAVSLSAKQPLVGVALSSCTHLHTFLASSEDRDLTSQSRQESEPVVMMPLSENSTLEETAYLMSSSANADRLIKSIGEMRAGKAKVRHLIEE